MMTLALPFLAVSGSPRRILAVPGQLRAPLALQRAQVGAAATALAANGLDQAEFAADIPRFAGPAQLLQLEGQRTNSIRNPRAEGAIPGTPGTLPGFWSVQNTPAGLTRQVVGTGTEAGMAYVEINLTGTPNATSNLYIIFDTTTGIAAAAGQSWAASATLRSVGTPAGVSSVSLGVEERTSGGGYLAASGGAIAVGTGYARFAAVRTLSHASCAAANAYLAIACQSGVPVSARYRIAWPQLERGAAASSAILPPTGALVAATRGAEAVTAALSALGVASTGAGTWLWSGRIQQLPPAGAPAALLQLDGGTDASRLALLVQPGGTLVLAASASGVENTATLGSVAAGSACRLALATSGGGRVAASLNGGVVAEALGGPVGGLTTLRLGTAAAGGVAFAELRYLAALAVPVSDAALRTSAEALPA